ncbi:MAG: hydroxymethylbilane synthase [Chthoniobacteraceae bacterium]|nr:hydroxymethylbilane synthase [Chthoniobacteraceae bacterium]
MQHVTLGTRGSPLALAQAELTLAALRRAAPGTAVTVRPFTTSGDRASAVRVAKQTPAGAKGLFTKELEDALLRGEIDLAVHSCKDLPGQMPGGLILAAVLERAATADLLLAKAPGELPPGAHVGTSSIRRARQLRFRRPDLVIEEVRGNVATRLRKLRESAAMHGIVLAQAGLDRLGFRRENGVLQTGEGTFFAQDAGMLPAIGQGAIALQCRAADAPFFAALNHAPTALAIRAERELMRLLNGDCTLPVGVATELLPGGGQRMRVLLFGAADEPPRQADVTAAEPEALAAEAFRVLRGSKT